MRDGLLASARGQRTGDSMRDLINNMVVAWVAIAASEATMIWLGSTPSWTGVCFSSAFAATGILISLILHMRASRA